MVHILHDACQFTPPPFFFQYYDVYVSHISIVSEKQCLQYERKFKIYTAIYFSHFSYKLEGNRTTISPTSHFEHWKRVVYIV